MGSIENTKIVDKSFLDANYFSLSHVFPLVFNAAMQLNLFGIIGKAGPNAYVSATEIASQLPTQNPEAPSMIDRMMRLFASHSLVTYSLRTLENGKVERLYGLTPACKYLIQTEGEVSCI